MTRSERTQPTMYTPPSKDQVRYLSERSWPYNQAHNVSGVFDRLKKALVLLEDASRYMLDVTGGEGGRDFNTEEKAVFDGIVTAHRKVAGITPAFTEKSHI